MHSKRPERVKRVVLIYLVIYLSIQNATIILSDAAIQMTQNCLRSTISNCRFNCCSYQSICPACIQDCNTFTFGSFTPSSSISKCSKGPSSGTYVLSTTALINIIVWSVLAVILIVFLVVRKLRATQEANQQGSDIDIGNVENPQQSSNNDPFNLNSGSSPAYPSPEAYPNTAYPNPPNTAYPYPNAYPNTAYPNTAYPYPNAYPNAAYPYPNAYPSYPSAYPPQGPNTAYPAGYFDPNQMQPAAPGHPAYPEANPIIIVK